MLWNSVLLPNVPFHCVKLIFNDEKNIKTYFKFMQQLSLHESRVYTSQFHLSKMLKCVWKRHHEGIFRCWGKLLHNSLKEKLIANIKWYPLLFFLPMMIRKLSRAQTTMNISTQRLNEIDFYFCAFQNCVSSGQSLLWQMAAVIIHDVMCIVKSMVTANGACQNCHAVGFLRFNTVPFPV